MILLVEDDPPSSRAVALALKTAGYDVLSAGDGPEAPVLLAKHHFEFVITDLVMPGLNGINLINTIRVKWPDLPLVVMSSYFPEGVGIAVMEGISAFLRKPIYPTDLIATVERLLPKSN